METLAEAGCILAMLPILDAHGHLKIIDRFRSASGRERHRSYIQASACPLTHCCYKGFSLIPPSSQVRSPFLPLRREPQGVSFPAGRTTANDQAPGCEGMQTMTDVALAPGKARPRS